MNRVFPKNVPCIFTSIICKLYPFSDLIIFIMSSLCD